MAAPIRTVAIAGGGLVAWSAAAAIRRRLPNVAVTVIASPPPPDALADRLSSTLPSILDFHGDLRLADSDVILRANSSFRMGTLFEAWGHDEHSYVHAYGEHGIPLGAAAFHHHWVRAAMTGDVAPFDSFSPAAVIGRAGRIVPREASRSEPLSGCVHGLEINPPRYHEMMRAFALHLGAKETRGTATEVVLRPESGFIDHVLVDNCDKVGADLFLDCSGPAAMLRSKLGGTFDDWSPWLSCDRLILGEAPPVPDPSPLTTATAHSAGWRWEAQGAVRTSLGIVYSSAYLADEEAAGLLAASPNVRIQDPATIHQGRWSEAWRHNCVAVGDAFVSIEPLEWTNLHLAHSAIDRIISMMPDVDCAAIELAEYNRQSGAEADRVRDFLTLHYATAGRNEPFWHAVAATKLPPSLAHSLDLFRERGRLPFYEEETFTRDGWLAVLLGQGVWPRRVDPLVDTTPADQARQAMNGMREALDALARRLPTQGSYFQSIARQASP